MKNSLGVLPRLHGIGGPASFLSKLTQGLLKYDIQVNHDPLNPENGALLIIGGTHQLLPIYRARKRGVRIVQRLDGINWLHKRKFTNLHHYLRSEWYNLLLSQVRRMADHIVYQSKFTRDWWQTVYGKVNVSSEVVYNGVDLQIFRPKSEIHPPRDRVRILVVEGSFGGGHEQDLFNAVDFCNALSSDLGSKVELTIAGRVPAKMRETVSFKGKASVLWKGMLPHEKIPDLDRSAHLLFPAEINAACPNSVVEALACGLPVVSYATGSLPELVGENGGVVVPYGRNYWKLEPPNVSNLVQAAKEVLENQARFREAARERAVEIFSLESMVGKYFKALFKT